MIVVASQSTSVSFKGELITLREGEPWDGYDPFVKANPGLFTENPVWHVRRTRPYVEDASAAPGVLRGGPRGR